MSALLYLIPLSMLLALIGLIAFFWTMNSGQYDDIEGVSQRILLDEEYEDNTSTPPSDNADTQEDKKNSNNKCT